MKKENQKLLEKYMNNECTEEEALFLLHSLEKSSKVNDFECKAEETWENLQHLQTPENEHLKYNQEAKKLLERIQQPQKKKRKKRSLFFYSKIAAAVLLILSIPQLINYYNQTEITYLQEETSFGTKKTITLPDNSVITLNSCSSIRYPDKFIGDKRTVKLTGEAYFKIAHNKSKPFIVNCTNFKVRVLGTQFNIKTYPKDEITSVSVSSGCVNVELPDATMQLIKQEKFTLNTESGSLTKQKNKYQVATWRQGKLQFNKTPIKDVVHELERMYNCKINFTANQEFDNYISGEHEYKTLEEVLESIKYISDIKYKKQAGKIILYK